MLQHHVVKTIRIPFWESMWTHRGEIPTGFTKFPSGEKVYKEVEHWGRRETCKKCHSKGYEMADFKNIPTGRAAGLSLLALLVLLFFYFL